MENKEFKIVFMGTPEFAVATLDALNKNGYDLVGVITAPDRPAGRGQKVRQSAVKEYAVENTLHIMQPENLKDESFVKELSSLKADLFVVVAFRMLPKMVWSIPSKGTINLHGSLLPQYRGAAPINWAVINGENETGVTTFYIDEKIDTGDVIQQKSIPITDNMTAGELHDSMMHIGADLVVQTVGDIKNDSITTKKQDFSTDLKHAPKIFRKDCKIDTSKSIQDVHNLIRGMSPYPAAWLSIKDNRGKKKSLKLFQSEIQENVEGGEASLYSKENELFLRLKDGVLKILVVQLEGKKKMDSQQLLTGYKPGDWAIITN